MMDNVELQATCAALGYQEGNTYVKEPDCLETVKDLIRFLKREDEYCDVRRQLGEAQILQRDLVPIIKHYKDDRILLETVLRLMVNLTQPGKLCFQNVVPEDKTVRNYYLEVESHLQAYKEAFVDEVLFGVLTKMLGDLLQLDWENRQEEDRLIIERILIIVRNILHVPPDLGKEQRTDDDASIHDQVLWALHISGMEDLLLYLASCEDEQQFTFHVLEIVSLMFREQTPDQLASAGGTRSLTEKEQDEKELAMIREQEKAQKKANVMKYSSRHSRFGGTFTVANIKSISERDMIYHRSLGKSKDLTFDTEKRRKRAPKNRRPLTDRELTRRSTLSIRLYLKEFCVQFLENCYNTLMRAVKDTLVRSRAQENDETYYLWAMRFFMEFNRKYKFRVELVSETLSVPTFHYIQTNLQNFHEMILSNKKEAIVWSRRMHLALKSYRELIESVYAMDLSKDPALRESSKVLKNNVFYMLEYRDVFLLLLRKFNETQQSRSFLTDLIETTHLFVKMLESYSKGTNHIMVQKKKRKKHKKKKQRTPSAPNPASAPTDQELEDLWDDVSSELSAIFQGRADPPPEVAPFDAASEVDVDQQRACAMFRVQEALRQKRGGEAIALIRAAREVWPEREEFGRPDIAPEEEFMSLREVFFAQLPRPEGLEDGSQENGPAENDDEDMEDYEEEEQEASYGMDEQEFNFKDFELRFAQPQILRSYTILLADFKKNSVHTNHCILKMLHRMGVGSDNIAMLFHVKIFRVFQKVMLDPACRVKHFEELYQFSKYVVRKFFEVAQNNVKVYAELFFWKSSKQAMEIVHGYGSYREHANRVKQIWTEEQDMELTQLFQQYSESNEPGKDVVDLVLENLIDQTKTRRQVLKQLINLSLIGSSKELKKSKGAVRGVWTEEQELELRQLYDQCKDDDDIMGSIIPAMTHPRSKIRVTEKLMELGLVKERRELYKKKGRGNPRQRRRRGGDSDEDEVMESREEGGRDESDGDAPSDAASSAPDNDSSDDSDSDSAPNDSDDSDADADPQFVRRIKAAVRRVLREDSLRGPLAWIRRIIERTADDREEDNDEEPIPVVPLQEDQEDAMTNKTFRSMLKKVGLKAPRKQQERYWRIPGRLTPDDLRSRVAAMVTPSEEEMAAKKTSKKNERFNSLLALMKNKKTSGDKRNERKQKRGTMDRSRIDSDAEEPTESTTQNSTQPRSDDENSSRGPSPTPGSTRSRRSGSAGSNRSRSPGSRNSSRSGSRNSNGSGSRNSSQSGSRNSSRSGSRNSSRSGSRNSSRSGSRNSSCSGSRNSSRSRSRSRSRSASGSRSGSSSRSPSPTPRGTDSSPSSRASGSQKSPRGSQKSSKASQKSTQQSTGKKRSRPAKSSVESSGEEDERPVKPRLKSAEKKKPAKRARILADSSDEEVDVRRDTEAGMEEDDGDKENTPAAETTADLKTFPATMMSQPLTDSDSDLDDHVPLKRAVRQTVIDSDSDE